MPAVASRYWRIGFRSATNSGSCHLPLSTLKVLNASLVDQTGSATVTVQNLLAGNSAASLSDNSDTTTATMTFSAGTTLQYVTYDFGSGNTASLNSFLIRVSSTVTTGTSRIPASELDIVVQSSSDNTAWLLQTFLNRPLAFDNTDYYQAMIVDSQFYTLPTRTQLAGAGGIYGIVSEDGVALPNRPVILYNRDDFSKIGYATTDEGGAYAFNGLNENREYLVMSVDPSGPPYKNALVYDRIVPINTRALLPSQSVFWAQRLRDSKFGFSYAVTNFLDGPNFNAVEAAPGSQQSALVSALGGYWPPGSVLYFNGYTTPVVSNPSGAFKFLKSDRTSTSSRGTGIISTGSGYLGSGNSSDGNEYNELSFEVFCVPPATGENPLAVMWNAAPDDGTATFYENSWDTFWSNKTGPVIEITPTAARFRISLGTLSLNTIRASAPVVQNQVNHIIATYSYENVIKLYVNGVLAATTSIPNTGRMFTHEYLLNAGIHDIVSNYNTARSGTTSVAKCIVGITVTGSGTPMTDGWAPGFDGIFGAANWWGRELTQSDVTKLYNSFIDPSNFIPDSYQSGYAGEVEADNPSYYFRMNDTSMPPNGFTRPLVGRKTANLYYRGGTVFGANANFAGGNTAVDFSNSGGAYVVLSPFSSTFSVEMWIRPTSLSVATTLFSASTRGSNLPARLTLSASGMLTLITSDTLFSAINFPFTHTALVVNTSYHIVVSYDPWAEKTAKLYINGQLVDTRNATSFPSFTESVAVTIGVNSAGALGWNTAVPVPTFGTEHFRGIMGEFAWYNHRLPADRVQAHYAARNF